MNNLLKEIANEYSVFENGRKYVLVKISDTPALENMEKWNWWFRHPAYFQFEDLCKEDHERADRIDCLIENQDVYHEQKFGIKRVVAYMLMNKQLTVFDLCVFIN